MLQKSSFPAVDVRLDVLFDLMFCCFIFSSVWLFFVVSDFTIWSLFVSIGLVFGVVQHRATSHNFLYVLPLFCDKLSPGNRHRGLITCSEKCLPGTRLRTAARLQSDLAESKLVHQKLETENFRHAHRSGRAPISLVSNKTRRRRGHPIGSFNPMFPDRHSVRSRSGAQVLSFRVRLNLNTARKLHSIFTVPSCEET